MIKLKNKSKKLRISTTLNLRNGANIKETGTIMASAMKIMFLGEQEDYLLKMGQTLLMATSRMANVMGK